MSDIPQGATKYQYRVVNIGSFGAADRLFETLSDAGSQGWDLVAIYDKASNWFNGMEKGFMLFKRPVPPGVQVVAGQWCEVVNHAGTTRSDRARAQATGGTLGVSGLPVD